MLTIRPRALQAVVATVAVAASVRYLRRVYLQLYATPPPPKEAIPQPPPPRTDASPFGWIVLWDIENVAVPRRISGHTFVKALRSRLAQCRSTSGEYPILRILAVTNMLRLPVQLRSQLLANGVTLQHVDTKSRKDAADKALITELCLFTREHPPPFGVVLISGDVDFAYPLARIRNMGYTTVLIAPHSNTGCSSLLRCIPDFFWSLYDDVLNFSQETRPTAFIAQQDSSKAAPYAMEVDPLKMELVQTKLNAKPLITQSNYGKKQRNKRRPQKPFRCTDNENSVAEPKWHPPLVFKRFKAENRERNAPRPSKVILQRQNQTLQSQVLAVEPKKSTQRAPTSQQKSSNGFRGSQLALLCIACIPHVLFVVLFIYIRNGLRLQHLRKSKGN